jgi:GNAT superfamily N-acetyltransferase
METRELDLRLADPDAAEGTTLVGAMEEEIEALYADRPGSIHSAEASANGMSPPHGAFIVAVADGRPVGCGGLKRIDDGVCEIKRMYVAPEARGQGLARRLLDALEEQARALGYTAARLDTGDRQPTAKRLYESAGYREIPDYNGNVVARHWFEKEL